MRAMARGTGTDFSYRIDMRDHQVTVDEPTEVGGADEGPSPQELLAASIASCTAITMQMYARRKGWDIGPVEVECAYEPPRPATPTHFEVVLRLRDGCSPEQVEALRVIAGKCPVHRALEGASTFEERVELVGVATES